MSIVSLESADEKNVSASILNFLTAYGVISLLSKCGGTKLKGIPVKALFTYTSIVLNLSAAWKRTVFRYTTL